jgi:hypothetical protein
MASRLRAFKGNYPVASQTLGAAACLLAVLGGGQAAKAQDKLPPPPKLTDNGAAVDPANFQQQRFLHSVAQTVIYLEAKGDRTMEEPMTLADDKLLAPLFPPNSKALLARKERSSAARPVRWYPPLGALSHRPAALTIGQ